MNTAPFSTQRNLCAWGAARKFDCFDIGNLPEPWGVFGGLLWNPLLLRLPRLEHFGHCLGPLAFSLVFELVSLGIVPNECYFCSLYALSPILFL